LDQEEGSLMPHEVLARIEELADQLEEQSAEAEHLGRLPDDTAKQLKATGVTRMLQPAAFGGYEADPRDFLEAVTATASHCGAAGWVVGVVSVHAWEMALMPTSVQEEVWGEDPDTWIASPYALLGKARPVDGGYLLNGRWSFSSGTDHCKWIWLGAKVLDADGNPVTTARGLHVTLPRSDYEIVEDSWNVVGLRGTGSKDIVVRDAFVPTTRTIESSDVYSGLAAKEAGRTEPLYRMPWSAIFANGISAALNGICLGGLDAIVSYQRDRINHAGGLVRHDPYFLATVSEAASDIDSARAQMMSNVGRMWEIVQAGDDVPFELRAQGRRDQVRGAWRAVAALDKAYAHAGGNALRMDHSIQRFWRDAHAALNHTIHTYASPYRAYATLALGGEPDPADTVHI
jgi:alkylation response protein AidB-like acyl-CoA dehydrogenase